MALASLTDPSALPPWPRTSLIGRAAEREAARAMLSEDNVPLLTLTGPGGVGKTRLALEIGHDLAESFADGVLFVDLSPIRDPTLVLPAIAQSVGVRYVGKRNLMERVGAALKSRQVLLLLDNCEQVLDAATEVGALLSSCPALQVLATSRAALRIQGEQLLPVPPLALSPAVATLSPADT